MKFGEKVKKYLASTGLRSFGILGAGIIALVLFGSTLLMGVAIGAFIADNIVTIKELINK